MIEQYKASLIKARHNQAKLRQERLLLPIEECANITPEETLYGSICDSLTYVIEWLESGREPGTRRGAHKRPVILMDPLGYTYNSLQQPEQPLEAEQTDNATKYLSTLTEREQEAYRLIKAEGFSYGETAKLMGVARGAVQMWVKRAGVKLRRNI